MSKISKVSSNLYNYYRLTPDEFDFYELICNAEKILHIEITYSDGNPPYHSYVVIFKDAKKVLSEDDIIREIVHSNHGNICQCLVNGEPYNL